MLGRIWGTPLGLLCESFGLWGFWLLVRASALWTEAPVSLSNALESQLAPCKGLCIAAWRPTYTRQQGMVGLQLLAVSSISVSMQVRAAPPWGRVYDRM